MSEKATVVEKLFQMIDDRAAALQNEHDLTYLEAVVKTGEILFQNDAVQNNAKETIRKAVQLAALKGMKEAVQPHHEMTPDAVAIFTGYLVNKWIQARESITLLDPVVGTGNLLTAVMNQLSKQVFAFGVEADETLLKLAYVNANLQRHDVELFHGDAVKPLFIDPVDVIVADLPVGYYPNDDIAASFALKAEKGRSLIHYLLIEQSLNYAKAGAVLIFIVPNSLFERNAMKKLNKWLKNHAVIQGILQLPLSMFKNEKHAKSIFMLQKNANNVAPPKQVLLAELPSFSNQQAITNAIAQIDAWFEKV